MTAELLRVMTINVWSGLDYRGILRVGELEPLEQRQARYRTLVDEILRKRPHLIGINEANPLPRYILKLAKDTGYRCIYHVALSGLRFMGLGIPTNLREGDAIMASMELDLEFVGRGVLSGRGSVGERFSFHWGNFTQVLVGRIRGPFGECFLAVTHFSDDPEDEPLTRRLLLELKEEMGASAREYRGALAKLRGRARIRTKEAENLLGYIQRVVPEGSPCLLLGDLNAEVGSPELSMILDSGFQDTYPMVNDDPGYTWDPVANPLIEAHHIRKVSPADLLGCLRARLSARRRRIDYILFRGTRPDCPVVESSLCANSPLDGTYASDHFGVMTTFRFS